MIFDTDVLIWVQRGNTKAALVIDKTDERLISIQTYMELMQDAQNRKQHQLTKDFLKDYEFEIIPISENISHRAAIYVEEYSLSHSIRAGDAIIAATATENNLVLCTGNKKHFQPIKGLQTKIFKP
jgi:predicted nucleic acid-binding protein